MRIGSRDPVDAAAVFAPDADSEASTTSYLPSRIRVAWEQSFLSVTSPDQARALLDGSWEAEVAAGDQIYPELNKPRPPHLLLVLAGLVRVYRTSQEGREVTVRHARKGDIVGAPSVVANAAPAGVQAVTISRVMHLPVDTFRGLAKRDPTLMWGMSEELTRSLFAIQERLTHQVFTPVRTRVARQIVDLATDKRTVHVSQQEIADAIGSVREVVGRIMSAFREEGLLERGAGELLIIDYEALHSVAQVHADNLTPLDRATEPLPLPYPVPTGVAFSGDKSH